MISLVPGTGLGVVNLLGDDRAALDALWSTIAAQGKIALRQRDDRSYGDLELTTSPHGVPGTDGRILQQFVYTFDSGTLVAASASGPGVDLLFDGVGSDDIRCTTTAPTSYSAGLIEACKEWGPHYPGLIPNCPW